MKILTMKTGNATIHQTWLSRKRRTKAMTMKAGDVIIHQTSRKKMVKALVTNARKNHFSNVGLK